MYILLLHRLFFYSDINRPLDIGSIRIIEGAFNFEKIIKAITFLDKCLSADNGKRINVKSAETHYKVKTT